MKFLVDIINVFPDGFGTDAKFICDFLIPEAFCKETQHFGIITLLGFILAHNEPSIKLFRYAGFQEWGALPGVAIINGVERGLMIFGKRVA